MSEDTGNLHGAYGNMQEENSTGKWWGNSTGVSRNQKDDMSQVQGKLEVPKVSSAPRQAVSYGTHREEEVIFPLLA